MALASIMPKIGGGMSLTAAPTPSGGAPTMGLFSALAKQMNKQTSSNAIVEDSPGKMKKNTSMFSETGDNRLELVLNTALKKRMGLDYLSERSGIDMRKFEPSYVQHKLDSYKTKTKKTIISRQDLIDFVAQHYHVSMTLLSATDAILFCRGPQLDSSDQYNEEKLIHWLSNSLPGMRSLDDRFQPRKSHAKSLSTSQDNFHLFKMSGVGVINKRGLQSQRQTQTAKDEINANFHSKTLQQMNQALKECDKAPGLKRRVQETLNQLEQSMIDYRAQKGMEASVAARRRLRHKAVFEEESKEKNVQVMLEQTAVLDSPIRAANLQEVLKKQWCEYKDSYVIMSKLTKKQKQKLNDMIFNRYNDI